MKNPETIIRGIMHEAAKDTIAKLAAKHVGSGDPKKVKTHFTHDEKAAKDIVKLAQSMEEQVQLNEKSEAWQRKEGKNPEGGLNKKGVASYRKSHPGSKLKTAVTTEPSKLKPGSKSAKRRKSFCSRMKGMKTRLTSAKTARDPDSRINKSLRKWNCE
jgi:hypothetical protein